MRIIAVLLLGTALAAPVFAASQLSSSGTPSPASLFDLNATFVTGVSQVTDFRWLPDGRLVILTKSGTVYVRSANGGSAAAATTPGTAAITAGRGVKATPAAPCRSVTTCESGRARETRH